ncbi:SusC/RagA family TonB-linked outer membrane protein [Xylanibacter ruminicola]|uniref:SusC/RagA family TonB-linked outer membrane protein n=1 Tax=Xylanibacter ruminicola TaxID=839 RepID=UPI000490E459|nr:SusC/RagA family TonB-linked outer membrane protein [Xylanibacter ruminicola]
MKKSLTLLMVSLFLFVGTALAQTKITGTVLSQEDGQPIIGAAVKVDGTNTGMLTDVNGKFSLTLPEGKKSLTISYLGFQPKTVTAKNGMRVFLKADATALEEVVVTAMGISRQQKTLGYSAQTLKDEELTVGKLTDVTSALAGKVAGVQISASSANPGTANSVIIRGFSSINGNNQPLYVIDGVPMQQTSSLAQGNQEAFGGISNVNPNDIESMTVLKGAAATALYGSRAANGVIVITTKGGKKNGERNFQITYDGSVQWRQVSTLPKMQNQFGQGWNGKQTYIENGSWGPEFDSSMQVYGPIWNHQQLIHKYEAVESNIKDFFETGLSTSHSVALSGVSDDNKMTYYLSYSFSKDDGIIPSNKDTYTRNTIAYRGSYEATKWLKLSSSVNFAKTSTDIVGSYQGTSMIDGIMEFPRDISLVDRKNLSTAFDTPEAWYTPYGITNPYWAIENNYNHNDAKQLYGKIQADIKPIKQLTLSYRFGFDYTDYDLKMGYPQIALDDALINEDYGYAPSNMNQAGWVFSRYQRKYELNHDFLANFADKYLDDKLDVNVNVGVNMNERYSTVMTGQTDDLTFETGFWDLSNGATKSELSEGQSKRRLVGLFGDVTLGWDEMLYLNLTARNDWSSTLPINANSYFYPGATLSWIFTRLIPKNDILEFGKLRLAYGKTGNDADPYQTAVRFIQGTSRAYYGTDVAKFPMNGVNSFQASSTIGSSDLKPEMTTEYEVGLNLALLKNRINIDFSFYNRETKDQIFTLPVDPATGYSYMVTNFGNVRNRGIELLVNTTPIQTKDFRWDLGFNFSKNQNKVLSMPASVEGGKTTIYNFSAGNDAVYFYAEEGNPMGEFYTYMPQYTEDGKLIVGSDGQPILTTELQDTGKNMNPDWIGGVTTAFYYKGFSLSGALDIRKGGYMFSRSKNLMQFTGNGSITTYNQRRPFIIPNSVYEDGTENTTPIMLGGSDYEVGDYQDYYNNYGWGLGGEAYLVNKSYVKLRNITLAYQLPKSIVNQLYLSDVTLSLFCNNVFTWTHKSNTFIDPESSTRGNDLEGQFGELYVNPSCRTFGFNVGIKF